MTIELLKEMVAIPSVNPEHTTDPAIANEYRMAVFLSAWLSERGFTVKYDAVGDMRGNVVGRYGPDQADYTILFAAHLDTVGIDGMTIDPFTPVIKDGRCYGRGACDMKGALAAALTALDDPDLLKSLAACGIAIMVVGAYGEETGNIGAQRLANQGMTADAVIVLEPTCGTIVHAHKGALWTAVTLHGQGGHGSNPQQGCNAILAAMRLIPWLQTTWLEAPDTDEQQPDTKTMGPGTVNIGRIEGGNAINIIAPRCRLEIDRRLVPGESPDCILAELDQHLQTMRTEGWITGYEVEVLKHGPAFATPIHARLVADLQQALEAVTGAAVLDTAAWHSDAGALSRTCREVVVFGPGDIAQAHTPDEFIDVRALEQGTQVLRAYLEAVRARRGPEPQATGQ